MGALSKQRLLRLSGLLFLLAAVVFCFTRGWWMAILEAVAGVALLVAATRLPQPAPPPRKLSRRRGRP